MAALDPLDSDDEAPPPSRPQASGRTAPHAPNPFDDTRNHASFAAEADAHHALRLPESNDRSANLECSNRKSQIRFQLLEREVDCKPKNVSRSQSDDKQFQSADRECKSLQELEDYAFQKSEETTGRIRNCLKVAEDMKGDATRTLVSLHGQGEQVTRTHEVALDIDQSLSVGEKFLGSLGGLFSMTWKPRRGRPLTGPVADKNDYSNSRAPKLEQRFALGLVTSVPKGCNDRFPADSRAKLEMERTKQDDALSDLSNVLDELKGMSLDMGTEISRQNVSLDYLQNDILSLDERVQGANVRGRRLLGK